MESSMDEQVPADPGASGHEFARLRVFDCNRPSARISTKEVWNVKRPSTDGGSMASDKKSRFQTSEWKSLSSPAHLEIPGPPRHRRRIVGTQAVLLLRPAWGYQRMHMPVPASGPWQTHAIARA